jgi:hypothetical protein
MGRPTHDAPLESHTQTHTKHTLRGPTKSVRASNLSEDRRPRHQLGAHFHIQPPLFITPLKRAKRALWTQKGKQSLLLLPHTRLAGPADESRSRGWLRPQEPQALLPWRSSPREAPRACQHRSRPTSTTWSGRLCFTRSQLRAYSCGTRCCARWWRRRCLPTRRRTRPVFHHSRQPLRSCLRAGHPSRREQRRRPL